jgi:uncharacterized membrane protein HdeD (DUF308 family)
VCYQCLRKPDPAYFKGGGAGMLSSFTRNWWAVALRGLIAFLIGGFLIFNTGDTLTVLTRFFGIFLIVDGLLTGLLAILGHKEFDDWWLVLLYGLLILAIGIALWTVPELSVTVVVYLTAISLLISGLLNLILAWRLRKEYEDDWFLVVAGLLGLLFGWIIFRNPAEVTEFVLVLLGIFLVIIGLTEFVFGFKLRQLIKQAQ